MARVLCLFRPVRVGAMIAATMRHASRITGWAALLAVVAFAVASCGRSGGAALDESPTPTPSPSQTVTEPVATPTAPQIADGLIAFTQDLPFGDGTQTTILVMDPDGTNVRTVLAGAWQPTWSPDGTQIAYSDFPGGVTQVFVMNADGSGVRQLTDLPYGAENPTWSPDGTRIAYTVYDEDVMTSIWTVRAVDGQDPHEVVPAWYPDGRPTVAWEPSWGPDGRIAFSGAVWTPDGQEENVIFTVRPDGTEMTRVTPGTGSFGAKWSPDGQWLAFERYHGGDDPTTIQLIRPDGSDERQLVESDGYQMGAAWSPDGTRILFGMAGPQEGGPTGGLWIVDVDGSDLRQILPDGASPSWQVVRQ